MPAELLDTYTLLHYCDGSTKDGIPTGRQGDAMEQSIDQGLLLFSVRITKSTDFTIQFNTLSCKMERKVDGRKLPSD